MREIRTTTFGLVALVDDQDYPYLSQFSWYAVQPSRSKTWYARATIEGQRVFMHREIMTRMGYNPAMVDHRDRNGLHNWRSNLRACDSQLSGANRGDFVNNTSGVKGVTFHNGKYQASIRVNGRLKYLGRFTDINEAAQAYQVALARYFPEV